VGSLFRRKRKRTNGTVILLPTLWLKYHQHGRQVRESSGTTNPVKARRMLRDREGDVEKGVPVNPQMGRLTFDEAAKALVADYTVNNRSTLADVVRRVDVHLAPSFRMHRLGEIRTTHVQAFTAARLLAGASRAEVNRELAALKRMFTLAIRAGQVVAKPHIPMLREDNTRRGFFEANEFERLREALPLPLQPVVTFAYLTGWRLTSEVLPLTWSQVDFKASVVRLDPGTTKNREGRSFPFTQELHALLKAKRGPRPATSPASRAASRMTFAAPPCGTWSWPACHARRRWPWSATRPRASTGATRLSTPAPSAQRRGRLTRHDDEDTRVWRAALRRLCEGPYGHRGTHTGAAASTAQRLCGASHANRVEVHAARRHALTPLAKVRAYGCATTGRQA